ncbi:TraR/DksA family transcriptional regulator [Streptomyces zagrosensis]|uniref:RNA polymerase-binding protein DksA n=1 Tax=Streptomyces zagrosensis TaxID=1042984 RepID=A0A7W9Q5D4_9ACTN|nr:TraR/DksA C4-type zinc finger protein [Streptomyces zagrosensis]MBB5933493.1 RNA polymerase-binding protein DksA [Streptomyces zagrosensis]
MVRKTAVQQSTASAGRAAPAPHTSSATSSSPGQQAASARKDAPAIRGAPERKTTPAKKATTAAEAPAKAPAKAQAKEATAAAPAKERTAQERAAKQSAAKKSAAKKNTTKKNTAKKAAPAKKAVPAKKTGAKKVAAKETPGGASIGKRAEPEVGAVPGARVAAPAEPGELAIRPDEDPWSPAEVDQARTTLEEEAQRLRSEIQASEEALSGLLRDSGDGAGDDQADTGTKNVTREHEMALNSNAREMLLQSERALARLEAGTYGLCENCGNPIGKARMQAFPRATLCVECKQRQERR